MLGSNVVFRGWIFSAHLYSDEDTQNCISHDEFPECSENESKVFNDFGHPICICDNVPII